MRVIAAPLRIGKSIRLALGLLAACVVVLLVIGQLWRASAPLPPALHISGTGSVVVVTSDDGKRWVVNVQREPAARGEYVIAFPR